MYIFLLPGWMYLLLDIAPTICSGQFPSPTHSAVTHSRHIPQNFFYYAYMQFQASFPV